MSSKKVLLVLILIALCGAIAYGIYRSFETPLGTPVDEVVSRPDLNISFTFPGGEAGYAFVEPVIATTSTSGPVAVFIMMESSRYDAYRASGEVGDAPPSMTLFVFPEPPEEVVATGTPRKSRMERLREWATANTALTSYTEAVSTPVEVEIDGTNALRYTAQGTYTEDIYIMFNKNRYYLFTGQYEGESDATRKAVFEKLMSSVTVF